MKKLFFILVASNAFLVAYSSDTTYSGLSAKLIEAQIENQKAQADYYKKQAEGKNDWSGMLGIVATLITAGFAYWSLVYKSGLDRKADLERWQRTKAEEAEKQQKAGEEQYKKDCHKAAAHLVKMVALASHHMVWMLWVAKFTPQHLSGKMLDDYNWHMNELYGKMKAAQVMLASYSLPLYKETLPLVKRIYDVDGDIGTLTPKLPQSMAALGDLWKDTYLFSNNIPATFAEILGTVK